MLVQTFRALQQNVQHISFDLICVGLRWKSIKIKCLVKQSSTIRKSSFAVTRKIMYPNSKNKNDISIIRKKKERTWPSSQAKQVKDSDLRIIRIKRELSPKWHVSYARECFFWLIPYPGRTLENDLSKNCRRRSEHQDCQIMFTRHRRFINTNFRV